MIQQPEIEYISKPASVSMADAWFEIATEEHFWIQMRFLAIQKLFSKYLPDKGTFFEIGCGNCIFRDQVENNLNISIDACDLYEFALKKAKKGRGRLMVYDIMEQNPSLLHKYDGVFLMDVVEHIKDDVSFLKAAANYVKPGGLIVINVPALMSHYGKYDIEVGHYRRYNFKMMRTLFKEARLEIIEMDYWFAFLLPLLVIRNFLLRFKKKEEIISTGFAPPGPFANKILHGLKNLELMLGIPFKKITGSSLLVIGRVQEIH